MKYRPVPNVSISLTLLIALILNSPKLLSLQSNTVLSQWVKFDLSEFFFQFSLTCGLTILSYAFFTKTPVFHFSPGKRILLIGGFAVAFTGLTFLAIHLHSSLFSIGMPFNFFQVTYFVKSGLIVLFLGLTVYIWEKNEEARLKNRENERLQNLYLQSQLQALRQQLNPHFLFNALSSLSAVVRENPPLAQKYIGHLSNVFRYGLKDFETLVSVEMELQELESFFELIRMRFESAVNIQVNVPEDYRHCLLPHFSLQPLVENAIKHNQIHPSAPLLIRIEGKGNSIEVSNTLWPLKQQEPSTQLGLSNLEERFRILTGHSLLIQKTEETFTVKLPLSP